MEECNFWHLPAKYAKFSQNIDKNAEKVSKIYLSKESKDLLKKLSGYGSDPRNYPVNRLTESSLT
jgi:hypothetical protein